ncbi:hypothetical protein ACHAXT_009166 [Thalassiosira profunda]
MPSTSPRRKRKAAKEAVASPAKSPRRGRTSSSVRVEATVLPNNPEYDPIVVSFPRGVPPSLAADDGNDEEADRGDPPRFACAPLKASSSRGRRVEGEDDKCTYTASAAGRGHDGRLTKAYLVPSAEKGTIFALEQSVKEYNPAVANGAAVDGSGNVLGAEGKMSASDRVQMLVESFGSKKKQKVAASRSANKVNIHSVVGAGAIMMDSVNRQEGISKENKKGMEEGGMMNPNDIAYEQARRRMLPPYDANADAPSKVYSAKSIAGKDAWDKISRIVDHVLHKQSEEDADGDWIGSLLGKRGYRPKSIVAILESLDPSKKASHHRIKAAFLLYLMWKFRDRVTKRRMIQGETLADCVRAVHVPYEVGARLFELFTSHMEGTDGGEGGYQASKLQKDKLTMFVLILYVIAAGGRDMKASSLNQLCKDLKLDVKDASMMLREAGFVVKKSGVGDIGVSLPVPLKFPPPKRGKRT